MKLCESIQQFLVNCRSFKNLSHYTVKAYGLDLKQFVAVMGAQTAIGDINREAIQNYHYQISLKEYTPSTIKRKISCVKSLFSWLEQEERLTDNPFNRIKINIKSPRALPKNISPLDLTKILRLAKAQIDLAQDINYSAGGLSKLSINSRNINQLTLLVAVEILLSTGIRVAELINITLENIDFAEKKIKIMGKGTRERFVFLPDDEVCELLRHYLSWRSIVQPSHKYLVVNSRGEKASTQFVRKLIADIGRVAKLDYKLTPHMFRHSAACELLESDVDIRYVQRLLGHTNIATTEIYTHVTDSVLRNKIQTANIRKKFA